MGRTPPLITTTSLGSPPVAVVALAGDHDVSTHSRLERELLPLVVAGEPVVVDLTELGFAESATLGILVMAAQAADPGKFAVVASRGTPAARLLDLIDAQAIFRIFPTRDLAVEWCRHGGAK